MSMSILAIFLALVGFIFFLFFYWKRLREDYSSLVIFSSAFYLAAFSTMFALLTRYLLTPLIPSTSVFTASGLWFWAGILGLFIGFMVSIHKFRLKFFETLEAVTLGYLYWLVFIFVGDSIVNSSLFSLLAGIFVVGAIALFYFLAARYRLFTWYKSGKIGFAALVTLGVFFASRVIVALAFPFVLSFVGKFDILLSTTMAVILFYGVYYLS